MDELATEFNVPHTGPHVPNGRTRGALRRLFSTMLIAFQTLFSPLEKMWRFYANCFGAAHFKDDWTVLTEEEHYRFIACLIALGLRGFKGNMKSLWSENPINSYEAVTSLMSRDRFLQILRAWRPCAQDIPGLDKVLEMYETLTDILSSYWIPERDLAADEVTVVLNARCQGKMSTRHKNQGKFGHILYAVATVGRYLLYIKLRRAGVYEDGPEELGQCERFVWDAMKRYAGKGYRVNHLGVQADDGAQSVLVWDNETQSPGPTFRGKDVRDQQQEEEKDLQRNVPYHQSQPE